MTFTTSADEGVIAAAIDDGIAQGYGDDGIIDEVASALLAAGWGEHDAEGTAAQAVQSVFH